GSWRCPTGAIDLDSFTPSLTVSLTVSVAACSQAEIKRPRLFLAMTRFDTAKSIRHSSGRSLTANRGRGLESPRRPQYDSTNVRSVRWPRLTGARSRTTLSETPQLSTTSPALHRLALLATPTPP